MIPASYFFRPAYRQRFEAPEPVEPEPPVWPGRPRLDRVTTAILGFAFGAAHLPLGLGPNGDHARRR